MTELFSLSGMFDVGVMSHSVSVLLSVFLSLVLCSQTEKTCRIKQTTSEVTPECGAEQTLAHFLNLHTKTFCLAWHINHCFYIYKKKKH